MAQNGKLPNLGQSKPLPMAPMSHVALKEIYHPLLTHGMSESAARSFASGEYDGLEITEVLSEADLEAFTKWLLSMKSE